MRRNWQSVRGEGGDEAANQYATALAQIADAEFIESIVHGVSALNRFGGELRIAAYRQKFDAAGKKVERDEVGTHETVGYLYDYTHHSKVADSERNYNPDDPPELENPLAAESNDFTLDEPEYEEVEAVGTPVEVPQEVPQEPAQEEPVG